MDELTQYETDRPAWLAKHAPMQAERIAGDTYDDGALFYAWSSMQRDYQTAVWSHLNDTQRARIRKLRRAA